MNLCDRSNHVFHPSTPPPTIYMSTIVSTRRPTSSKASGRTKGDASHAREEKLYHVEQSAVQTRTFNKNRYSWSFRCSFSELEVYFETANSLHRSIGKTTDPFLNTPSTPKCFVRRIYTKRIAMRAAAPAPATDRLPETDEAAPVKVGPLGPVVVVSLE
jgi:hypothetical protein